MIITFADIVKKYDMKISGVIHIGGHYGNWRDALYIKEKV